MTHNVFTLCTKVCARILFDNSPNRKVLDEYTREELSLIIERIKVIRYILKVKRFNRTNIALFKVQEMIHKVLWTLGIYDLEVVAYELEKYIMSNALYNDVKDAMAADTKYGNPIVRGRDSLDTIVKLFDNSIDCEEVRAIIDLSEFITTEYVEYPSEDDVELMTNYKLIRRVSNFMYIDDIVLDHIKERLK
jgi:hypothetical protein